MPVRLTVGLFATALFAAAQTNPYNTAQAVEQGASLFQFHCAVCHGARGEGGRGADLTTGQYRRGGSDAQLFSAIRNGLPGTEMPAIRATDDEVWKMVAFVRKLGTAPPTEKAPGNPTEGQTIFAGKGRCQTCHAVDRAGGSFGPDLSGVGRRRDLKYLRESLLAPEAEIPIRYRAIQVVPKAGAPVIGIRLNEDDVSIQLRDTADQLRSFLKNSLKEIRRDQPSSMPSYAQLLSSQELDNVVAYLSSLRGPE